MSAVPPAFSPLPEALQRLLVSLAERSDLLRKLEHLARVAADLAAADHAEVVLNDPLLRRFIANGSARVTLRDPRDEALGWIAEHRQPLVVPDLNFATSESELALQDRDIAAYLGVPILRDGTVHGALLVFSKTPRSFDRGEPGTLEALAALAAQLLVEHLASSELEETRRTLLKLSLTDPMTGVATTRQFSHMLRREWKRATDEGLPISVMQLEIDAFQRFVESHDLGDAWRVLSTAARTLHGALYRAGDLVARVDDTKLVALLPETDRIAARSIAERLRREMASTALQLNGTPITLSVGVASFDPLAMRRGVLGSPERLVGQAQAALRRAQNAGGNRIEAAGTDRN